MKKGIDYEGIVTKMEFPNKGVVETDDGVAVVKGTITGQKVKFVVSKKRTGRCVGRLKEVLEKSSIETETDLCPYYENCGGCSYQTIPYEKQLELKGGMVKEILDNVCDSYTFEGITGSPINRAYRNKMEFSFGDEFKDGPLALGLHKKGSFHDIITVSGCKIIDDDYSKILDCVLNYCASKNLPFYKKLRHEGYLRHLLVRRAISTGEIIIGIVTSSQVEFDFKELSDELCKLCLSGEIVGVMHIINDSLSDVVQSDETKILYGRDYIYEDILGLRFKISIFSFFQTNTLGAEVLYEKAREYIMGTDAFADDKKKTVFDLYSGTGTIAQMMSPAASKVVGVEIVEEAVVAARENAKLNNIDNCEFIAGDVLKVIDDIKDKPDFIILDPPRDGINPKALSKIIDYGVDNIVYISCKPTSLARDLEVFLERGYKLVKACAVDMFPNTVHVETVVQLSK